MAWPIKTIEIATNRYIRMSTTDDFNAIHAVTRNYRLQKIWFAPTYHCPHHNPLQARTSFISRKRKTISVMISLKFVTTGPMDNGPTLVHLITCLKTCDNPFSKLRITQQTDRYRWLSARLWYLPCVRAILQSCIKSSRSMRHQASII